MLGAIWRYKEGIKKATALRNVDYNEEMMLWDFKCDEDVNKWDCISDREIGGQSKATFSLNKKNSGAIFAGILSTNVSLTSNMKYSGYCAIRSQPIKGSLFSSKVIDMSEFDAFRFRVRGDGRKYFINVQSPGMVRRDDVWQYFLFPRGGPQWEDITVHISVH
jgi:NADH dehydrogenase [ubiquinone] 1 alpha subcomplex assembly factor 1